jgi:hypothetical protein
MNDELINDIIRKTIPTYSEYEIIKVLTDMFGDDSTLIDEVVRNLRDIHIKRI